MQTPPDEQPRSQIRPHTLVGLIIANMIGAGVFTTSGFALADLGSPHRVMAAWLVGGLIAICGALSYGALAKHITESGGEYLILSRLIHPSIGFIAGCVSLIAGFTGAIAFAALAFETYMQPLLPFQLPSGMLAVSIVLLGAALHGIRVSLGTFVQDLIVGLKLILIVAFIAIAAVSVRSLGAGSSVPASPSFSFATFATSLVWISLSYSGYNAAVYIAGEAGDKKRMVPRAIWIGTAIVWAIYLCLNAVFVYFVPFEVVAGREDVAAAAAQYLGGESLALLVRLIIGISLLTSVFAMVMLGPRVYAKMADDGLFPERFRFNGDVPTAAIALQAAAAVIFITFSSLKGLLSYLGFTLSLCAALTVFCLFLIKHRPGVDRISIPGYPLIPGFFVAATLLLAGIVAWNNYIELLSAALTFLIGGALYLFLRSK